MGISNISINQKIEKHPTFQNLAKELDVRGKAANLKVSIIRKHLNQKTNEIIFWFLKMGQIKIMKALSYIN